jgi:hypothetical protein
MWDREVSSIFATNVVVLFKTGGGSDPYWYSIVTESDVRNGPLKISYEVVKRSVKRVTDY